jgi:ATP-binding cassette subfamily F protein 3
VGERTIFSGISGEIERGQRVALVAANGVGKTTLINCIVGKYVPAAGKVAFGHNVRWSLFEQEQALVLDPQKTIFQEVRDGCPEPTDTDIRTILGAFLFSGDAIDKKIFMLSGGEKNRVAMVKILLQRANFLILDEPTNHMDLYAKDVLRQALQQYDGSILFVSHDSDFVNRVATHIIELTPHSAHKYTGNYDEYCSRVQQHDEKKSPPLPRKKQELDNTDDEIRILKKEIATLERTIERLERDQEKYAHQLGEQVYGSAEYEKILARYHDTQNALRDATARWEVALRRTLQE